MQLKKILIKWSIKYDDITCFIYLHAIYIMTHKLCYFYFGIQIKCTMHQQYCLMSLDFFSTKGKKCNCNFLPDRLLINVLQRKAEEKINPINFERTNDCLVFIF